MANVRYALFSAGLHSKIKVSTSVSQAVLGASYPPSAGAFTSEADSFLGPIAGALCSMGSSITPTCLMPWLIQCILLWKIGGERVEVVVSETGWPSAGGAATSIRNAQTYNTNLIKHVQQGSPKRPGKIGAYILLCLMRTRSLQGSSKAGVSFIQTRCLFILLSSSNIVVRE
ncbi:hypothetical protein HPP92_001674 [Vanilla planifolia]|uniref:Glucan endo-1,3-beta-D-glucosidase n=1 Tax=Vanilla planifolia TaxID=51239 RepID=A0A835S3V8_VANPL|nr:hypothetical protein HPP92_001674 [Vanilla planifolia]